MQTIAEAKAYIESRHGLRLETFASPPIQKKHVYKTADQIVESFGLNAIGDGWRLLSVKDTTELAVNILHRSMAYSVVLMPRKTAEHIARLLLNSLDRYEMHCFSNGAISADGGAEWRPIGTSTFEMALVCFDSTQGFFLLAQGED